MSGAEDLNPTKASTWEILCDPKDFEAVTDALKAAKIPTETSEVTKIASTYTKLEGAQANAMIRLLEVPLKIWTIRRMSIPTSTSTKRIGGG